MIWPYIMAVGLLLLFAGIAGLIFDWTIRHDPEAKHGSPIMVTAIVMLIVGGVVGCAETMTRVATQ